MKRLSIYIMLLLTGVILGLFVMSIPSVRYDLNYNGKVDIADFIKYHNYYINH